MGSEIGSQHGTYEKTVRAPDGTVTTERGTSTQIHGKYEDPVFGSLGSSKRGGNAKGNSIQRYGK
jgi:hypothetical protein